MAANLDVLLPFLLLLLTVPDADSETCYSPRVGYADCWSGCCGPQDDSSCCSSTAIIVGVAVGGGVLLLLFVVVGVCLMCKCHLKFRDGEEGRRSGRGRRRGRGDGRRRDGAWTTRRVVHPVGPPDYDTATQVSPPTLPTTIPLSPPPPYTEFLPPPPTAPPPARGRRRSRHHAQSLSSHVQRSSDVTLTSLEEETGDGGVQATVTSAAVTVQSNEVREGGVSNAPKQDSTKQQSVQKNKDSVNSNRDGRETRAQGGRHSRTEGSARTRSLDPPVPTDPSVSQRQQTQQRPQTTSRRVSRTEDTVTVARAQRGGRESRAQGRATVHRVQSASTDQQQAESSTRSVSRVTNVLPSHSSGAAVASRSGSRTENRGGSTTDTEVVVEDLSMI